MGFLLKVLGAQQLKWRDFESIFVKVLIVNLFKVYGNAKNQD